MLAWALRTGQPLLPDLTQHCQLLLQLMASHHLSGLDHIMLDSARHTSAGQMHVSR